MKQCKKCQEYKPLTEFELQKKGDREYHRNVCNKCKNAYDHARTKETGRYDRRKERNRQRRHDPNHRVTYILRDCFLFDKAKGLKTDLNVELVAALINCGCSYCGVKASDNLKIGLDRIDNSKGHTTENVNACCTRCNFIRRNMPYEAWILLVPGIRLAVERGLMDNWQYGIRHHRRAMTPVEFTENGTVI